MQTLNRMLVSAMVATLFLAVGAVWQQLAAQEAGQNAALCLERPTVICTVDLALAASAASGVDDERAKLLIRTAYRLNDVGARKSYLDQTAVRFFPAGSPAAAYLEHERRVTDIAAAIVNGDAETADRRFGEVVDNFQLWWTILSDVIDVLAMAGRPELAVKTEARYHFTDSVNLKDALGRDLGKKILTTQQLLARSLVRCDCGSDALPMVLALPEQVDRLDNALLLYARRHDAEGLVSFLKHEFGNLAEIEDEAQREWVGYGFGLLARELPLGAIPAALSARPAWLTAAHFRRPDGGGQNIYGAALMRALESGDRAAVAALIELRPRDGTVWLSGMTMSSLNATAEVDDLLPEPERDHFRLLRTRYKLAHGDARKALDEAMNSPMADAWRGPQLDIEDSADFGYFVIEPLLGRGAFDTAGEAVRYLEAEDEREGLLAAIATARQAGPTDAAAILVDRWNAYAQSQADPAAGRTLLFAVRDLIATQPDAFPVE